MAKTIGYSSEVITGQIVEAPHVSQSIEAFSAANQQDYDISVSGSFKVTGSQFIEPNTLLTQNKPFILSYDETTGQIFKMNTASIDDGDGGNEVYRTGSSDNNIIPNKFGTFCNTGTNSTIASGNNNKITSNNSFIGGGILNTASGVCNFIGGGAGNQVKSGYSSVGGGLNNCNSMPFSFIGGGCANTASADSNYVSIVGGRCNIIGDLGGGDESNLAFIGGGFRNRIADPSGRSAGDDSFIGGGRCNLIDSNRSSIVGGLLNTASANRSFIGGGSCNLAAALSSTVVGGTLNTASGVCSFIGGGNQNSIGSGASFTFIGGGCCNTIPSSGVHEIIVGGSGNCTNGYCYSFIGGGQNNTLGGESHQVLVGGQQNCVGDGGDTHASLVGGRCNCAFGACGFIGGGSGNSLSELNISSVIVGGTGNILNGDVSSNFIGGGASNKIDGEGSNCNFIGGGSKNFINSDSDNSVDLSTIVGGTLNTASAACSFIGGGCLNVIDSGNSLSNIVGGQRNFISGSGTFNTSIVGGLRNTASGACSFIGGGESNFITSSLGTIVGGFRNCVCGYEGIQGCGNAILGGSINDITAATGSVRANNTITGGSSNQIFRSVHDSSIVGGIGNKILGCGVESVNGNGKATRHSFIGGGRNNTINDHNGNSNQNVIIGGCANLINQCCTATGAYCVGKRNTIINGCSNCIIGGTCSFNNVITGGSYNKICKFANAFIAGGFGNTISGSSVSNGQQSAAIIGGCGQRILGTNNHSFIGGGYANTISGSAYRNTIMGGYQNRISLTTQDSQILGGCSNIICDVANGTIMSGNNNRVDHSNSAIIATDNKTTSATNTLYVCNICVFGDQSVAGSKSFRIEHPDPLKSSTHELVHNSVESPTAGDTMYRFSITTEDNEAEIILPEYYRYLNENTQLWVSADGHFGKAFGIVNLSATKIKITSNQDGKYNVMVVGTRKDKKAVASWKGAEILKNNL